ncbi:type 4a pilus biogenesis protein PilO [Angustibacter sp. McL0619]|uniref:type 4a pilus biogenesis protein PilO n=1 Tax=Angustibacter sp. McL0619 TaxID=3415676 RepID=UPI003CF8D109
MSKTRAWSAGAAVVGVLLIVAAWFLLISPQRSEAASLRDQVTQQENTNATVRLRTQQLKAQFASLPARQAQLAEIKRQMPDNPALPSLVRDLAKYAKAADITLVSVAPAVPAPFVAAGTTATTGQVSSTQQIQTTIVAQGTYAELTLYLQKLQAQMRRAILVENIQLAEDKTTNAPPGSLQMTLAGKVFILDTSVPQASTAGQATAPANPAASGTAN